MNEMMIEDTMDVIIDFFFFSTHHVPYSTIVVIGKLVLLDTATGKKSKGLEVQEYGVTTARWLRPE